MMTQNDASTQCRVCCKSIRAQRSFQIFSLVAGSVEGSDTANTIAEMMGELADVTISPSDDRSKYICTVCLKTLERSLQLRQLIRAAEKDPPTTLQPINIVNISKQDCSVEYLDELKEEIHSSALFRDTRATLTVRLEGVDDAEKRITTTHRQSEEAVEDATLPELDNDPAYEEGSKIPFAMPPAERIANRFEYEHFEYLEIQGERCCGCSHIAASRDELMAHAKETHSQRYYPDASSYTCPLCYQKFATAKALELHNQHYLYSDVFLCAFCCEAFHCQNQLMQHLQERHQIELQLDERTNETDALAHGESGDTIKAKAAAKSNGTNLPITTLPDPKLIKVTHEFPLYRLYCFTGERCCACGMYLASLDAHLADCQDVQEEEELFQSVGAEDELHRCEICKRTFATRQEHALHEEERRNLQQVYQCRKCGKLFARKNLLVKHFQAANPNCNRLTEKGKGIVSERVEPEAPKQATVDGLGTMDYFCCCFTRCKEEYANEQDLLEHARTVHGGRRKENEIKLEEAGGTVALQERNCCPICRRAFDSEEKVRKHRNYKLALPKQMCRECGRIFMKASGLRDHQLREHLNLKLQFACEACGKQFVNRATLNKHRRVHEPSRNLPCSFEGCGMVFRDEQLMQRHYRNVHTAVKAYECGHCQKRFRTKESQDIHERTHTGARPFACRYEGCKKRYAHGTDRKRHERSAHTREKPHTCTVCGVGFLRKRELRLHAEKIHTETGVLE